LTFAAKDFNGNRGSSALPENYQAQYETYKERLEDGNRNRSNQTAKTIQLGNRLSIVSNITLGHEMDNSERIRHNQEISPNEVKTIFKGTEQERIQSYKNVYKTNI
jgi:hypothetical protein